MLLHSSRNKFMVKFSKTVLASKNVVESIIYCLIFCFVYSYCVVLLYYSGKYRIQVSSRSHGKTNFQM